MTGILTYRPPIVICLILGLVIDLIKTNRKTRRTQRYKFHSFSLIAGWKTKLYAIEYTYWLYLDTIGRNFKYPLHFKRTIYYGMLLKEPNFVYESLTASVNVRKNELNRVAIKIASFNMRTWFRGPLLPNRPSLKIKKSKVSRFFCSPCDCFECGAK